MVRPRNEPSHTLYFASVDPRVTARALYEICCQAGPVKKVFLPEDDKGVRKNFAFVEFESLEGSIYAWAMLCGVLNLYGRPVRVDFAEKGGPAELTSEQKEMYERFLQVLSNGRGASGMIQSTPPPVVANWAVASHLHHVASAPSMLQGQTSYSGSLTPTYQHCYGGQAQDLASWGTARSDKQQHFMYGQQGANLGPCGDHYRHPYPGTPNPPVAYHQETAYLPGHQVDHYDAVAPPPPPPTAPAPAPPGPQGGRGLTSPTLSHDDTPSQVSGTGVRYVPLSSLHVAGSGEDLEEGEVPPPLPDSPHGSPPPPPPDSPFDHFDYHH